MCVKFQEGFEGQMTEDNIEIGICNSDGFRRLSPQVLHIKTSLTTKTCDLFLKTKMFYIFISQEVKDYLANIQ